MKFVVYRDLFHTTPLNYGDKILINLKKVYLVIRKAPEGALISQLMASCSDLDFP